MRSTRVAQSLCVVLAAASLACSGSRGHDLQEGQYAFTELEVLQDPCGLLPASGLWDGVMVRSGDYVRIDYQLLELGLIGYYLYSAEEFYADGTAEEVTVPLASGGSCQVDQLAVHLTAITRSPTQFEGALTVRTYARADNACECELSVTYRADRQ
ncbi:MAG: hypothetical protein M3Y59_25335 [Myxococcota bacterium]|nr:hypothetical protein [Myxococcota bacterium]